MLSLMLTDLPTQPRSLLVVSPSEPAARRPPPAGGPGFPGGGAASGGEYGTMEISEALSSKNFEWGEGWGEPAAADGWRAHLK